MRTSFLALLFIGVLTSAAGADEPIPQEANPLSGWPTYAISAEPMTTYEDFSKQVAEEQAAQEKLPAEAPPLPFHSIEG